MKQSGAISGSNPAIARVSAYRGAWAPLKLKILDVRGLRYAAGNEEPDDPHAWKRLLERSRGRAEMRAGREHVVEQPDHLWNRIADRLVDRVVRLDLLGRRTVLLIMPTTVVVCWSTSSRTSSAG